MTRNLLYIVTLICMVYSCSGQKNTIDKSVVDSLDIQKYIGTWYEIARFDHSFERGLVGVTATYSLNKDGTIKVINAGYKDSLTGKRSKAIGKAKIPNKNKPSKLRVSFFWIFYSDYLVLDLDPDYQWALIGSNSDKYVWILSRTPQVDSELYNQLVSKLTKRGYDTSKLIRVKQKQ